MAASSAKGLGRPRPKFAVAQLAHKANTQTAPAFLVAFVAAGPLQSSPTIPSNSPICQRTDQVRLQQYGRRLKTLHGLTPHEFVCKRGTVEPERFRLDSIQQTPGLNTKVED
jgi:hypothetical protein